MRNDDWINHADDVPEELLKQAAEKEFENQYHNPDWNYQAQTWHKVYKRPSVAYLGVIVLGGIALTVFFWPYIKEWATELFEKISTMFSSEASVFDLFY